MSCTCFGLFLNKIISLINSHKYFLSLLIFVTIENNFYPPILGLEELNSLAGNSLFRWSINWLTWNFVTDQHTLDSMSCRAVELPITTKSKLQVRRIPVQGARPLPSTVQLILIHTWTPGKKPTVGLCVFARGLATTLRHA